MSSKLFLIVEREYVTRVRKLSFIIMSLLMPVGMLLLMVLPSLIMSLGATEQSRVAVVDRTERYGMTLTDGVLFLFAWQYLKAEEAAGTLFTVSGADTVKKLGIRIIVLPLVAVIISAVIYGCFGLTPDVDISSGGCVITGGVLILVSLIFRYGAELEEAGHEQI